MTDGQLSELRDLAVSLDIAKESEARAKTHRIELEEEIAAIVEGPEVGQKTVALDSGVKITVKRGFNYKADVDGIADALTGCDYPPPIKTATTRKLDEAGYEWYKTNHSTLFRLIAAHVAVTPKKVAVSVKGL